LQAPGSHTSYIHNDILPLTQHDLNDNDILLFALHHLSLSSPPPTNTFIPVMGVLLLLGLLRRLRNNNDDYQQDYEQELRREYHRQCKRQRRWNRRHPHCPAPVPAPVTAVPVVLQPAAQQSTVTSMQQPQVVQPAYPTDSTSKGISV
ncbi:hypothetical protein L915_10927, partial [Phytophthora nicotianae]